MTAPEPNTIICGDALAVLKTWPDACVDFFFTDPPYGHNNNNGDLISRWEAALGKGPSPEENFRPIANDGNEATELVKAFFAEARRLLKPGCCCCCCCGGGGGPDPQFARWSMLMDASLEFKQMVVWDKGPMGMGWHYRRSYETVLVGMKPGAACAWYDESNAVENIIRPGIAPKIIPSKEQHPTEKPPQLASLFIQWHTKPGDSVVDPFCGSGSTGEAAIGLGRRFIGIEIDKEFSTMAERRIAAELSQGKLL